MKIQNHFAETDRKAVERQDTDMDLFTATPAAEEDSPLKASPPVVMPDVVYFVVDSAGTIGSRENIVSSLLFEKRAAAEDELARLRAAEPSSSLDIWTGTFYSEPKAWSRDVVLANGTVATRVAGSARWIRRDATGSPG